MDNASVINNFHSVHTADIVHTADMLDAVKSVNSVDKRQKCQQSAQSPHVLNDAAACEVGHGRIIDIVDTVDNGDC